MSAVNNRKKYQCTWPWTTLVILSDGRAVCGCADPYAQKVLGDTREKSISDIWNGSQAVKLRNELKTNGYSDFCRDCPLKSFTWEDGQDAGYGETPLYPSRLFIEPSSRCNLSCYRACCGKNSKLSDFREKGFLDRELFKKIIDESGEYLVRVDLFNYGETFLNKDAVWMCSYIKQNYPEIYLFASTNGLAFTESSIIQLIDSGIDELTFSIDGSSQESYERYRIGGNFDKALNNLKFLIKERNKSSSRLPWVSWRYILFKWNDSDDEMSRAINIAKDSGVDRLTWEITSHPEDAFSRRFIPGTEPYRRIENEIWDNSYLGNAIPARTPQAMIRVNGLCSILPVIAAKNRKRILKLKIRNISDAVFYKDAPYGRRLVRLGAQLFSKNRDLIDLNFARAFLKKDLYGYEVSEIAITIPPIEKTGLYRLKFDMVMEGIDWFEKAGSRVLWKWLLVL